MDERDREVPLGFRIALTAATYTIAMAIFFTAGALARGRETDVATRLDDLIPFVPEAMAGYALAYVVPALTPWIARTRGELRRLSCAVILGYVVAAPFFVFMPVRAADPPLEPANVLQELLELNRQVDRSKNAFPSMHVGVMSLLALAGWRRSARWGLPLTAAALVVAGSTLLVKQHFVVDLPTGALVALLAYRATHGRPAVPAG